jgi:hypothetical protein
MPPSVKQMQMLWHWVLWSLPPAHIYSFQPIKKCPAFREHKGSLSCLQYFAIGLHNEPVQSIALPHTVSWCPVLIWFSHLSVIFLQGFQIKFVTHFLFSHVCFMTSPTHPLWCRPTYPYSINVNTTYYEVTQYVTFSSLLSISLDFMEQNSSWEASNLSATQEIPCLQQNSKVCYHVHKSLSLVLSFVLCPHILLSTMPNAITCGTLNGAVLFSCIYKLSFWITIVSD